MKFLGYTPQNGAILEFSQVEYSYFKRLFQAVEGKGIENWAMERDMPSGEIDDYSGVFGAIRAFSLTQFRLNELKHLVGRFEQAMKDQGEIEE
jgi:hypothetical protein